jgi:hypothetical protein
MIRHPECKWNETVLDYFPHGTDITKLGFESARSGIKAFVGLRRDFSKFPVIVLRSEYDAKKPTLH